MRIKDDISGVSRDRKKLNDLCFCSKLLSYADIL